MRISEEDITIKELISAHKEQRLEEIFVSSDSKQIRPITKFAYKDYTIDTEGRMEFVDYLNDIFYDIKSGDHPWVTKFDLK